MSILLTVPHAVCIPPIKERHCDRMALRAALTLDETLEESILIIGNELRSRLDLNRDISLNSDYRRIIRLLLESGDISLLLDIHSFPQGSFGEADIAILDEAPGTDYGLSLYFHLKDTLEDNYRVGYYHGERNSIMMEGRKLGVPSLLLEFSESLDGEDIKIISSSIRDWVEAR